MAQIEHKAVFGLELQSNSFQVREGSLEIADNIVVSQDNIYKKRRGQKDFVDPSPATVKALKEYGGKLVGICEDSVKIFNQDIDGEYTTTDTLTNDTGLTFNITDYARTVESNGNLYFTSDNGILKIESTTGKVFRAGIPKALDLEVFRSVVTSYEAYFKPDSQVGYKVVFFRKDANENKVVGAPSQTAVVTNALTFTGSTYTVVATTATVTSVAHSLTGSRWIYIKAATGSSIPDGPYYVTVTGVDTFTFTVTSGASTGGKTLSWGQYKQCKLRFTTPTNLKTTEYGYQIYRTDATATASIEPDESTLQLVDEANLIASDLPTDVSGVGFVTYYDTTLDILRQGYLYTNPNTGEGRGAAEANEIPPTSTDIESFKDHLFYSNCQTFYRLPFNLLASDSVTMPDASEFTIKDTGAAVTRTLKAYTAVGNNTVQSTSVIVAANLVTVNYTSHGFVTGDFIAIVEAVSSSEVQNSVAVRGEEAITRINDNQFTFVVAGTPAAIASLSFFGTRTAAGKLMFYAGQSNVSGSTGVSTVSTAIDATARSIVKAINLDSSKVCNGFYVSGSDDVPGKMILESTGTTTGFYVNAVSSAIVDTFLPQIPTTGTTVAGTRDDEQGVVYVSKNLQPESSPIYGKINVGTKSNAILREKALRDSLIVLKEEGAYRINGSSIDTFIATILDNTVSCVASDSVATLNNQVYCLSQQGVVAISETAASIVSRQIEPLLTAVLGKTSGGLDLVETQTHSTGYESERVYLLSTMSPQSNEVDVIYVYNQLTQAWTTWNNIFNVAYIKPSDDRLYMVDTTNIITRERKNNNRLDYTEGEASVTVDTTPTMTTATLTVVGGTPEVGDVLVVDDVINKIINIEGSGGSAIYTFANEFGFVPTDTGTIYGSIASEIKTSPIHGGKVSTLKQFSEFQATYRNNAALSGLTISFITDSQAGSVDTVWTGVVGSGGWGNLPWGNFPWGLEAGVETTYGSGSAQPIRLYIPLEVQRATWIQCVMTHTNAAEPMMLQAIALTAREYGQRTTK